MRRAHGDGAPTLDDVAPRTVRGFNRWNAGGTAAPVADIAARRRRQRRQRRGSGRPRRTVAARRGLREARGKRGGQVFDFPVAASSGRAAYVAGTFDTKGRELLFLRQCLEKLGLRVVTVDLATSGKPSTASVHPREVARHHPDGESRGLQRRPRQRGRRRWRSPSRASCRRVRDLGGLISAGGSGGTSLATPAACARCRSACPR